LGDALGDSFGPGDALDSGVSLGFVFAFFGVGVGVALLFAFFLGVGDGVGDSASVTSGKSRPLRGLSLSWALRYAPIMALSAKMIAIQMRKRGTSERNRPRDAFNSRKPFED
jgi:hypothetical protein